MHFARTLVLAGSITLALSAALAGCGDSGPGEPLGENGSASVTPFLFTNDKAAYDYFVGKGLANFQAAGIVGNLDQESGVDPNAVQGGGPGRGIAQWSVGGRWDTDSGDNATAYASQHGLSVWSLQLQLDFIWYELTTFSGYGLAKLKATTNVTDATVVFETDFEGCGQCEQATRISYAQQVLNAYGAAPPYAAQFVSQSFPLASTDLTMTTVQVIPSYIELKNVGSKTWDSSTRLATTEPRDRHSAFANATWLSPSRLAEVKGTVPPGGTYKFTFDLAAPSTPGTFDEFFGVVQEGVAWFSDSGEGGPPDNQLEVKIVVKQGPTPPPPPPPKDGGVPASDGGVAAHDGGAGGDSGVGVGSGPGVAGGGDAGSGASDNGALGAPDSTTGTGGCSAAPSRASGGASFAIALAAAAFAGRRRRAKALG